MTVTFTIQSINLGVMEILLDLYRRIFARTYFFRFNYLLLRFGLSGIGVLNYRNNRTSGELYLIDIFLPSVIKSNRPLLLDVGANVGHFSQLLLLRFPNSIIHCFEPHPNNFKHLQDNLSSPELVFHNVGLGDASTSKFLFDRKSENGSEHASIYKDVISDIHKQETIQYEITIKTLDQLSIDYKWDYIDYLKIDTEGHELSVLRGASKILNQNKIGIIHFEFNEMNVVSRVFFRDFRAILFNYNLYRLLPNELLLLNDNILTTEIFAYQNIVAIPKSR